MSCRLAGAKPLFEAVQAGKLKFFATRLNWAVSYIAYTKLHLPRPVFHSPGQIFTRIGDVLKLSSGNWRPFYLCLNVLKWHEAHNTYSGLVLVYGLNVSANERRRYICYVFSHRLRTCSAINKRQTVIIRALLPASVPLSPIPQGIPPCLMMYQGLSYSPTIKLDARFIFL